MNKYHAVKTTIDGIVFDSKREAARYQELCLLEKAGEITDLSIHPAFLLADAFNNRGEHYWSIVYKADFKYQDGDAIVVEDIKGTVTQLASLKMKWFRSAYPQYELRIVK
jgi:hypothetical protein